MRTIYTTERIRVEGVEVLGAERLSPNMQKWISANKERLVKTATAPERMAAATFRHFSEPPVRQAFFMIRKRCYFLDFFFPSMMTAVEIDGSSHQGRKERDRRRDADLRSVGIRTIRIKNKDVMGGRLLEKLTKRLYR